ncbi:SagB family peptide dehydrogenase [Micromonospora tarensis]|uniref:SagB family peptide dehydrogenase n=1 Tax=Micromonospora tarensis TaxID=2806100 RepID=A0ABS1YL90_9ACTN|nr:SagB family peptide dehydrogenase [Micromonospora tarensis]MBM0278112.1 SagB family peptide dehydrogenase [Micromonospora tarensis]
MQQEAVEVVREYTEAVFRRARTPMEPLNYEVDWVDQPSRHKSYPDAPRLPLPVAVPELPTLRDLHTGAHPPPTSGWSLTSLAALLRLSYGVLDRRLAVNWNQDVAKRAHFEHAVWGRGTASGGGMYPVELYLVAGADGPLLPGVYHYHTGAHVLERLLAGDLTGSVRAALDADADAGGSYLLASIRFWKNSFKYNSFCYHVVTQDLGALLGSWDLLAPALGVPVRRLLCFDPAPLDRLLDLDGDAESVFAVVPVDFGAGAARPAAVEAEVRARYPAFERSRRVREFPTVTAVHRAAAARTAPPRTPSATPRPGTCPAHRSPCPPRSSTGWTVHCRR